MIIISFIKIIRAFARKIRDDCVSAFAAQAALFVIISFFPFFMLLLTILQDIYSESTLLQTLTGIFPSSLHTLIIRIITEVYDKTTGTIVSFAAITALWAASRGVLAVISGLNSVYGIKETRNYIRLRLLSAFYTFIFIIMLVITLSILVFGNRLYIWIQGKIPVLSELALFIISVRTMVGLLILTLFFLLLYAVIPDRKTRVYKELPGAFISAVGWMGFSYLFSYYVDHMGNYSNTYGSLTAIVIFMLWFYFCMYILFIGAEINVVLYSGDLVYFIKQIFIKRKAMKRGLATAGTDVQIEDQMNVKRDKIIRQTIIENKDNHDRITK
jgi:membrane protein